MPRRSNALLRPPSLCLQLPRLSLSRWPLHRPQQRPPATRWPKLTPHLQPTPCGCPAPPARGVEVFLDLQELASSPTLTPPQVRPLALMLHRLSRCLPQRCLHWPPPILCRALTSRPSGELRGQSLMWARASVPCSRAAFQLRTPRGPLLATLLYRTRVTRPVSCRSTRPPFRPLAPRQLPPSNRFRPAPPRRAALATGPWISRRLQRCHAGSVAALGMALQPLLHRLFPSARARCQQLPRRPVLRVPGRVLRLLRAWCAGLAVLGRACSRSSLLRRCGLRRCSSSLRGCHTPLSRSASWVLPLGVACLPPLAHGGAFQSAASRSTAA